MIEGVQTKKLDAFIARHASDDAGAIATLPAPEGVDPIVHELVFAFMVWEAGAKLATDALTALNEEFVDYNEARIGMSDELAELLPGRYPLAQERCQRLRVALNTVFQREHALTLASLSDMPKREGRAYLDSIEGMTPFVASRVSLLSLSVHAFPMDARLVGVLASAGVCDAAEDPAAVGSKLERHFRAGQAAPAYTALELASINGPKQVKPAARKSATAKTKGSKASKSKTKAP